MANNIPISKLYVAQLSAKIIYRPIDYARTELVERDDLCIERELGLLTVEQLEDLWLEIEECLRAKTVYSVNSHVIDINPNPEE